jgi:SpoVK/Ycf46/Vps4 family AAA+-type ATPase
MQRTSGPCIAAINRILISLMPLVSTADTASKLSVLRALTRKFCMARDVDLTAIAADCPEAFTGADMYALCSDAWMAALKRRIAAEAAGTADGGAVRELYPSTCVFSYVCLSIDLSVPMQYETT